MVDQCLLQSFDLWKMEEETASTEDRTDGLIAQWELQRTLCDPFDCRGKDDLPWKNKSGPSSVRQTSEWL